MASYTGIDFARQLREQRQDSSAEPRKAQKARTSTMPKGSKFGTGYIDRSAQRRAGGEGGHSGDLQIEQKQSVEGKLAALDTEFRAGKLEQHLYEMARNALVGGNVGSVHLVKGLDRRLLLRVRRGEDVLGGERSENGDIRQPENGKEQEVDAELEALEAEDVKPIEREALDKRGRVAAPLLRHAGLKRTRDDIIWELKAARREAKDERIQASAVAGQTLATPALSSRFKKVGSVPVPGQARIERDDKGREVLITVDAERRVKRKLRKTKLEDAEHEKSLPMSDANAAPLGADAVVPEQPVEKDDGEDVDIFEGAGVNYDPIGIASDTDVESEPDEGEGGSGTAASSPVPDLSEEPPAGPSGGVGGGSSPTPKPVTPRNYFSKDSVECESTNTTPANPFEDPTVLSALKRAAAISGKLKAQHNDDQTPACGAAKPALALVDRDEIDMDLTFGSSRLNDEDEEEDRFHGRSAEWDNEVGEIDDKQKRAGQQQRKRGRKKRKGDKHSAADVLAVLHQRAKTK